MSASLLTGCMTAHFTSLLTGCMHFMYVDAQNACRELVFRIHGARPASLSAFAGTC